MQNRLDQMKIYFVFMLNNSVRISKAVNGVKYTYAYLNGMLMYETRGEAKFYYSYDANGTLYSVKYTLTDSSDLMTYYYTHNSRGDIVGIYNGAGQLRAHYEYDAWGNVLSVTDQNGNAITSSTHIGNLNPFRYRGYYLDTETGLYYLMSRYYDPVTHRFVNADGYFQSGEDILDSNMSAYCRNNPISYVDPTGTKCSTHDPYYVPNCFSCNPTYFRFMKSEERIKWYNEVTGKNAIGLTDDGIYVYMITENNNINYRNDSDSIFIMDYRNHNDPNIKILNSVSISEYNHSDIIEMIQKYNYENPSKNEWKRSIADMAKEWDAHNFIFTNSDILKYLPGFENAKERAQSVDFNNADEGKYDMPMMW